MRPRLVKFLILVLRTKRRTYRRRRRGGLLRRSHVRRPTRVGRRVDPGRKVGRRVDRGVEVRRLREEELRLRIEVGLRRGRLFGREVPRRVGPRLGVRRRRRQRARLPGRVLVLHNLRRARGRLLGPPFIRPRVLDHFFHVFPALRDLGLARGHAPVAHGALLLLAHDLVVDLADVPHEPPLQREVPLEQLLLVRGDAASSFPLPLREFCFFFQNRVPPALL